MQCTQKMLEYPLTCRIILIVQRRPRSLQVTAVCHNDSGQVLTSFLHINAAVWIGWRKQNPIRADQCGNKGRTCTLPAS